MQKEKNKTGLSDRIALYDSIEKDLISSIEEFGLDFSKTAYDQNSRASRLENLASRGAKVSPGAYSVYTSKRSSACEACRHGVGSLTLPLTMKCNKSCFFCFNPNQEDYEPLRTKLMDWKPVLEDIKSSGFNLTHLAITGGEPLLFPRETEACISFAKQSFDGLHTRLYTNGTKLNASMLRALKKAGLDEIRFSIKLDEGKKSLEDSLLHIKEAKDYIPSVLVEMPVLPGTGEEMKELLHSLDDLGIFGINLLEFCYPLNNAEAFAERGFELKYPPFRVFYNYWYSGGFAIAKSEKLCFDLVEYSLENKLSLCVHYCSLENKNTGQVFQQNKQFEKTYPQYQFSTIDFFLKTLLLFDEAAKSAKELLESHQVGTELYRLDDNCIRIHPSLAGILAELPSAYANTVGLSYNIVENQEGHPALRELKVETIDLNRINRL